MSKDERNTEDWIASLDDVFGAIEDAEPDISDASDYAGSFKKGPHKNAHLVDLGEATYTTLIAFKREVSRMKEALQKQLEKEQAE